MKLKVKNNRYTQYVRQCASVKSAAHLIYPLPSIMKKLEELGYSSDDFITRYDEKWWKWNSLVCQPRPLTDRGKSHLVAYIPDITQRPFLAWNIMRPKLEETIRLRKHAREIRERGREEGPHMEP